MKPLQVRIDDETHSWLAERAERSLTEESADLRARMELGLWRGHLAAELARYRWTLDEIGCIADVMNGTVVADSIGHPVTVEISDAFNLDPGIWGEKWGLDEGKLLERVRRLGPTAQTALAEAVARWWETGSELKDAKSVQAWAAVGVRIIE